MKKLLLFLLILTGINFAQTTGKQVGSSVIYTDSVGYTASGTADSVWVINLNFTPSWLRVFVEGNSNSPVDSIAVRFGSIRYSGNAISGFVPADTVWGSYFSTMKDSAYNNCTRIINNTVGKDYFFLAPAVQLVEFSLKNHRGGLVTRNSVLTVQAIKD